LGFFCYFLEVFQAFLPHFYPKNTLFYPVFAHFSPIFPFFAFYNYLKLKNLKKIRANGQAKHRAKCQAKWVAKVQANYQAKG